jgi:hypothetical protein
MTAFIGIACIFLFAHNVSPERCLQAGLQIMWAHLQIIRAEKTDVCSSYGFCLQAASTLHGNL